MLLEFIAAEDDQLARGVGQSQVDKFPAEGTSAPGDEDNLVLQDAAVRAVRKKLHLHSRARVRVHSIPASDYFVIVFLT